MTERISDERQEQIERQLASDRRLYGSSYHRVVDGRIVRIPPEEVYINEIGPLPGGDA